MAISLKRYEPQVGVTAKTGTQMITGATASAMIQAAGARDRVMSDVFQAIGTGAEEYFKRRDESELLRINNELQIASEAFNNQIELETDIDNIDKFANEWTASQLESIDTSKLTPNAKKSVEMQIGNYLRKQRKLANTRIAVLDTQEQDRALIDTQVSAEQGNIVINPETNLPFESLKEQYNWAGLRRVDLGTEQYESHTKSVSTFEDSRKKVLENNSIVNIRAEMRTNNVGTIKNIQDTLSGKANNYPNISSDKLRSMLVEAEQIESENQKIYYTNMYLKDDYNALPREERKQEIIEAYNAGQISEQVALAEFKRAEAPTDADIKPDDFLTIAQGLQEIRLAGADNQKLNTIINKYAGMALPPQALTKITNAAFAASDVKKRLQTEEFYTAESEGLRKFDNFVLDEVMLEKAGGWFDENYPAATKKERENIREQLLDMAESEFVIALEEFAMSGDQEKTLGQLNSQAIVILNNIKRRYQATEAQDRLEELKLNMLSTQTFLGSEVDLRKRLQQVKQGQ
jgi:hypothetical protein